MFSPSKWGVLHPVLLPARLRCSSLKCVATRVHALAQAHERPRPCPSRHWKGGENFVVQHVRCCRCAGL